MQILYPEIKPYARHDLAVDDTHVLYLEECGEPDGIPVLFVHGGPGAGCSQHDRRYFNPEKYRPQPTPRDNRPGSGLDHDVPTTLMSGGEGGEAPGNRPVREIMTRSVLCVSEDLGVNEVASMMINKDVEQVPVVQAGAITGMVARVDIIRKLFGRA